MHICKKENTRKKKMQIQLPLFPVETKLITPTLGLYEREGIVYYLHNGSPIFCHKTGDKQNYKYITAHLINARLCTPRQLSEALGVSIINFQRYVKQLREEGSGYFFNREEKRGQCYKYDEQKFTEAQKLLDAGQSVYSIAKKLQVSEGSIRYHIKSGKLKKKEQ
jgi:hypothetical protein